MLKLRKNATDRESIQSNKTPDPGRHTGKHISNVSLAA